MSKHIWNYAENEYCVEEAFKNFVINREYDVEFFITKMYIHFDGKISKSSIKMKLQNIKYLLILYNVPNTLALAPLEHVAEDNKYAFFAAAKKYNSVKFFYTSRL